MYLIYPEHLLQSLLVWEPDHWDPEDVTDVGIEECIRARSATDRIAHAHGPQTLESSSSNNHMIQSKKSRHCEEKETSARNCITGY